MEWMGANDVAHRSVTSMVVGGNISWENMFGTEIMAVMRAGFCCWSRESTIIIILILTPRV